MSTCVLVIGESGSGKSTSLRTLNPEETYLINIIDKPLPFKGARKNYVATTDNGKPGNYFASDDVDRIIACIRYIDKKLPNVKNIVIDDWQYTMSHEYMRRARETGYGKFTEIQVRAWGLINELRACRNDLCCFILSHSDTEADGKVKCKTIGKLLSEKISIEGIFTIVLHSLFIDGSYKFLTNLEGSYLAKSPMGMFDNNLIDNDMQLVRESIINFYEGE